MSRIGKLPIEVPAGVTITVDGDIVTVKGPKGELTQQASENVTLDQKDGVFSVTRKDETKKAKSEHGLMRSLINNMVIGVTKGFEKQLELNGVGYKVEMQGTNIKFALGFSHDVIFKVPEDVKVNVDKNKITVSGISKQRVGQVAAEIRSLKKPEPYKGKGIKYVDEQIVRKAGKAGSK
jgi:large subunit ribosomal protein L6